MQPTEDLVGYFGAWCREYAGPPELVVGFERGNDHEGRTVGRINADGLIASGQMTIWESGDLVIEVYESDAGCSRAQVVSRVCDLADLASFMSLFVCSCVEPAGKSDRSARPLPHEVCVDVTHSSWGRWRSPL